MVERLRDAIAKARAVRMGGDGPPPPPPPGGELWDALPVVALDPDILERNRLVSFLRTDASAIAFDMLRTRLQTLCAAHRWTRVGVTSPTKGCGKTLLTLNLAASLARQIDARVIALDCDMRTPAMARRLGVRTERRVGAMLRGDCAPAEALTRLSGGFADKLALGLSAGSDSEGAELLQSAATGEALKALAAAYRPTMVLCDLPPMAAGDDTLSALRHLDCLLLVVAGGHTTATEVRDCERVLADAGQHVSIVLNRSEDADGGQYEYAGTA